MYYMADYNLFTTILFIIGFYFIFGRYYKALKRKNKADEKLMQMQNVQMKLKNNEDIYEEDLNLLSDEEYYKYTKRHRSNKEKVKFWIFFAIIYIALLYYFN